MNLLNKLTIKNLKLNKKRTIVTIIGIMLSVALITAVSTIYSSMIASLISFETHEKGNFHTMFYDVPIKDIETIKNNRGIDDIYITTNIGYANLKESKNEYKPYVYIKGFNDDSLKNLSINLVDGRLPKNDSEILIPTHLKTNGRVDLKIGESITLEVGTRVSNGKTLTQSDSFSYDNNEEIINTTSKTYKIVGLIERPSTYIENSKAPGYTFVTLNNNSSLNTVDIYVKYNQKGVKNDKITTANILGIDEKIFKDYYTKDYISESDLNKYNEELNKAKYKFEENSYLIKLETDPINNSSISGLGAVVVIVCGIIVFTSVFCIKNSFDISITEKIKQYGMLRSIGATKKQIKKNVFYEATILGLIGIPLGILIGLLASYILIIISNHFISGMLINGLRLQLSISIIAIIVAIILGIITIYLSAIRSAKKASKISPIECIKNSASIKIKANKLKSPKIIDKIFGIGGDISYKNLKRNRKKYRTTVISIVVSVSIFIALSSFMDLAFMTLDNEISIQEYNLSLSMDIDNTKVYDDVIKTVELDSIENYTIKRNIGYNINNPKYDSNYKKLLNIPDDDSGYLDGYINVTVIGKDQYQKYIKELGLNYDDIKDKAILADTQKFSVYDQQKNKSIAHINRLFAYKKGDRVSGKLNNDNNMSIEIGYVTDLVPFGLKDDYPAKMIVSDELYNTFNIENEHIRILYKSSNPDKLQDNIDEILKGYNYYLDNSAENVRMMQNLYTLVGIFLYGFIIVISLIGITNIFNTITTNMNLRKQEFAMLKSIGMTNKEFQKMIRLESIFMGLKSLIFGIPIGIGLSYLIFSKLRDGEPIIYKLPFLSIVIASLAVFILIICIMKYSISKISKQNTIETIRNENI